MQEVTPGSRLALDAVYRDADDELVDPTTPLVDILDPTNSVVANDTVPVRSSLGLYDYPAAGYLVPVDAALGVWTARWTGTVDGDLLEALDQFEVVAAVVVDPDESDPITSADPIIIAIRALIGSATPPTDDDLYDIYERLGTVDAVALEVMRGRYADALAGPAKWSVEGDFSIDNTAVIAALSKQVAALEGVVGESPVLTVHSITRSDPWR